MGEQIISASGPQYGAAVDATNRLLVRTEGISVTLSGVSISAGSESYIKGGSILSMGQSGGVLYPLLTDTDGILQTSASVTTGSESWIQNPVGISGTEMIGSVVISSSPLIGVSGLIFTDGNLTGSMAMQGVGSFIIQSSNLIGVSGEIFDSGNITGSMVISSAPLLGVSGAIFDSGDITGSVVISSSNKIGVSGIVEVSNTVQTAGSIYSMPNITAAADPATTKIGDVGLGSASLIGGQYDGNVETVKLALGSFLLTAGSITSMPALSAAADPATTKLGDAGLGSVSLIGGYDGVANVQAGRIDNGSYFLTAGSIVTMPSVTVTATNLDIRDLTSASDSVEITGTSEIGSVVISSAPLIGVSGAIFDSGDITGSVVISSAPLLGVSGTIFTNGNMTGSMAMKGIGSMVISSSTLLGVSGAIFDSGDITGSMVISSASLLGVSGLIFTDGNLTGSMVISSAPVLGVSGAIFDSGDITGSVVISSAPVLEVSGAKLDDLVGSFAITNIGSVIQATNPWIIAKTPKIYTGSLIVSGGDAAAFTGSHVVSLNNEISWISIIGSAGSTYKFSLKDSEGYQILSSLTRTGNMSYMTPILASGDIVFDITDAQISGNFPIRIGYI